MPERDRTIRRRVLTGTASNYIGQIVTLGVLFFLTPFILGRLGEERYGLWIFAGSLVAYGSLFDFGLWGALIKYIAEYHTQQQFERSRQVVATAIVLYTGLGMVVTAIGLLLAPLLPRLLQMTPEQRTVATPLFMLMGVGVGIALPAMAPLAMLRGLQRYDLVNLVEATVAIVTALITVLALYGERGLLALAAIQILGTVLSFGFAVVLLLRIAPELRPEWRDFSRRSIRTLLGYSWPLFAVDVAGRLQTKTDEVTIGFFLPLGQITPYNLAIKLSGTVFLLTRQFMKVLLPLASELDAGNERSRLRALYLTGTRITLMLSLGMGTLLVLLARPFLIWWVGAEYASASVLVAILVAVNLVMTCQWPAVAVLRGMARHRVTAATAVGAGLLNLLLSILFIQQFGLIGVAIGSLIPACLEACIVLPYAWRALAIPARTAFTESFLPVLTSFLPVAALLLLVPSLAPPLESLNILIVVGVAGSIIYGISYLILGASREERRTYHHLALSAVQLTVARLNRF